MLRSFTNTRPPTDEKLRKGESYLIIGILACLSWAALFGIGCAVLALIRALA
jgi:hypothetical protein